MTQNIQPTVAKNRIIFLDVLRGMALMGILFANILSWSGLKFMPFHEIIALGNIETDQHLYHLLKFFVDTKFYTLFSILFGVGFYMQLSKNRDNPGFVSLYFRRLSLLLVIGLIHAFIWSGDILTLYALMGMVLLSMRNLPAKLLLPMAIVLYFIPVLLDIIYMYSFGANLPIKEATALKVYPDMSPAEIIAGFQSGNFITVFKTNLHNLIWRWYDFIPTGRPFKVLGLFLLGAFMYDVKFFTNHALKWKYLIVFSILGFGFTGLAILFEGSIASFSRSWYDILNRMVHEIGQISMSLAYICILAKLVDKFSNFFLFQWSKNYGRMSLTSYIGHTFFGILVFYPIFGFGYFGKLTLETTYWVALLILIVQLVLSNLWFVYFKFGPVEWLWRCATYKTWISIRK